MPSHHSPASSTASDPEGHELDQHQEHVPVRPATDSSTPTAQHPGTSRNPRPYSDQKHLRNANAKGNRQGTQQQRPQQKRPTHFICFPLVTDESIPQLAASLQRFRELTTAPATTLSAAAMRKAKAEAREREKETPDREREREFGHENLPGQRQNEASTAEERASTAREREEGDRQDDNDTRDLRIIPASAHRPPGTFHLTIGTMDLSDEEDMRRALALLKAIDYGSLMRDVDDSFAGIRVGSGGRGGIVLGQERRGDGDYGGSEGQEKEGEEVVVDEPTSTKSNSASKAEDWPKERGESGLLESLTRDVSPPPPPSVGSRKFVRGSGDSDATKNVGYGYGEADVTDTTTTRGGAEIQDINPASKPQMPVLVTLCGLGAFQSAAKARVFYAPPFEQDASGSRNGSGRLLAFANAIRQRFKDEGLVKEERALTLHATVANMTYAGNTQRGMGKRRWGRGRRVDTVDGRKVLEVFNGGKSAAEAGAGSGSDGVGQGGTVWARDVPIDRVRICKMGAEKSDDEVLGMVYPAVEVDGKKAEVVFG